MLILSLAGLVIGCTIVIVHKINSSKKDIQAHLDILGTAIVATINQE
jgi:hypothetical protein